MSSSLAIVEKLGLMNGILERIVAEGTCSQLTKTGDFTQVPVPGEDE